MLLRSYRIKVIHNIPIQELINHEKEVVNTLIKDRITESTKIINKIIIRIITDIMVDINIIISIIHIQIINISKIIISNQINIKELIKAIKLYNKINKHCHKILLFNNSSSRSHPPLPPLAHHSLPRPSRPLQSHSYSSHLRNFQKTQENLCHQINRLSNRTHIHKINLLNSNKHHIQKMIQT